MQYRLPLGQLISQKVKAGTREDAAKLAFDQGEPTVYDRVVAVADEEIAPSFLHSALCSMSLPVRRPKDDKQPIIRADGNYTLVVTPKAIIENNDGVRNLVTRGVPYGSLPRVILIHMMSQAVIHRSRTIFLGNNFTNWMQSMGFKSTSFGPRGSGTLLREQLDRLLACEWMIRWDGEPKNGERDFGIKEVKLSNEYYGHDGKASTFSRQIQLSETFYDHLLEHSVPLNEIAVRQIKDSSTALDLYSWLAYRLPRIKPGRPISLSWDQLATHFGNDGANPRKFRQTIRDLWEKQVSAVYTEAKAEFNGSIIRLHASPPAVPRKTTVSLATQNGKYVQPDRSDTKTIIGEPVSSMKEDLDPTEAMRARFYHELSIRISQPDMIAWFKKSNLNEPVGDDIKDDIWTIDFPGKHHTDYVTNNFMNHVEVAANAAGFTSTPRFVAKKVAA